MSILWRQSLLLQLRFLSFPFFYATVRVSVTTALANSPISLRILCTEPVKKIQENCISNANTDTSYRKSTHFIRMTGILIFPFQEGSFPIFELFVECSLLLYQIFNVFLKIIQLTSEKETERNSISNRQSTNGFIFSSFLFLSFFFSTTIR